ncbi:GNAT family N-acetyltransferase [Desulfospira joergensenii]|uniref:GNAT family N-acetyltransferase n=1 Tax=Desulfospira joergensenii TaxID=53329 RepID=UPI0003B6F64A|nr:GNAT family N-acetyltransferase [Desulfospira joergensenii]
MNLTIRGISTEDIQAVLGIRTAISNEEAGPDFRLLVEQHAAGDNSRISLVAETEKKVVGYMLSTTLYAGFGIQKSAWIMALGVHPDYMGQGIGLELANGTCDLYRKEGVKSIYSSVLWDSSDMLSFFKKLGFRRSDFINLKKDL